LLNSKELSVSKNKNLFIYTKKSHLHRGWQRNKELST